MREPNRNGTNRSKEFTKKAQELASLLDKASQIFFSQTGWVASKWFEGDSQGSRLGRLGFYGSSSGETQIYHYDSEKILQRLSSPSPSPEEILTFLGASQNEYPSPQNVAVPLLFPEAWSAFCAPTLLMALDLLDDAPERFDEVFGERILWIDVHPGNALIQNLVGQTFSGDLEAVFVHRYGLIVFGSDPQQVLDRTVNIAKLAESKFKIPDLNPCAEPEGEALQESARETLAACRFDLSEAADHPLLVRMAANPTLLALAERAELFDRLVSGPATHHQAQRFGAGFRDIRNLPEILPPNNALLEPTLGLLVTGLSPGSLGQNLHLACETLLINLQAWGTGQELGPALTTDPSLLKFSQGRSAGGVLRGEIALVTNAASTTGEACVQSLLEMGCSVVGLDPDPQVELLTQLINYLGLRCDLEDSAALNVSLETAVRAFGGLDMVVHAGEDLETNFVMQAIESVTDRRKKAPAERSLTNLFHGSYPLLRFSPRGGRILVINTFAGENRLILHTESNLTAEEGAQFKQDRIKVMSLSLPLALAGLIDDSETGLTGTDLGEMLAHLLDPAQLKSLKDSGWPDLQIESWL